MCTRMGAAAAAGGKDSDSSTLHTHSATSNEEAAGPADRGCTLIAVALCPGSSCSRRKRQAIGVDSCSCSIAAVTVRESR